MGQWINTRPIGLELLQSPHMRSFVPPHEKPTGVLSVTEPGNGMFRFQYLDTDRKAKSVVLDPVASSCDNVKVELGKNSNRLSSIHVPERMMREDLRNSILDIAEELEAGSPSESDRPNRTAVNRVLGSFIEDLIPKQIVSSKT